MLKLIGQIPHFRDVKKRVRWDDPTKLGIASKTLLLPLASRSGGATNVDHQTPVLRNPLLVAEEQKINNKISRLGPLSL